jgi:hypothetical protein
LEPMSLVVDFTDHWTLFSDHLRCAERSDRWRLMKS